MILTFEEFCGEDGEFASDHGKPFAGLFAQVSGNNHSDMIRSDRSQLQHHEI